MISWASIDRCVRILLTTFYHMYHYTMQLLSLVPSLFIARFPRAIKRLGTRLGDMVKCSYFFVVYSIIIINRPYVYGFIGNHHAMASICTKYYCVFSSILQGEVSGIIIHQNQRLTLHCFLDLYAVSRVPAPVPKI